MLHKSLCHGQAVSLSIVYPIVTVFCSYVLDTNTRNAALPGFTLGPSKSTSGNAKADKLNAPENKTLGDGNPLLTHRLSERSVLRELLRTR